MNDESLAQLIRSASWPDLTERLLLVARARLVRYAPADRRRFQNVCTAYVERAVAELLRNVDTHARSRAGRTLFQLLGSIVVELIDADDREVTRIVLTADWEDVTERVLAYTVHKHGRDATRSGRDPEDRLNEAVKILLERRHHFPHYRGVSLVAFLCSTIDGIVSHDAEKLKNRGSHVRIVSARGEGVTGECGEDELPGVIEEPRDVIAEKKTERFVASLEPELQAYVHLQAREPSWTAKEYAEALNRTVAEVRNWDRKLKRRWQKFIQ